MFERGSRYFNLPVRALTVPDGQGGTREVRYVERRFLPPAHSLTEIAGHIVVQGDRLDNLTATYLGDPTLFWQVCDMNGAMHPDEITETIGKRIQIGLPLP